MKRSLLLCVLVVSACGGAAPEVDDSSTSDALTGGVQEGTPDAVGVLRVANELRADALQREVELRARAAEGIEAYRMGDDEVVGTSDDATFQTLAQLDAVPFVGPNEFRKMRDYARNHGLVPGPAAECTWASVFQAQYGQPFRSEDIGVVTADGVEHRGLDVLLRYPMSVKELRLLGTDVYRVLATRTGAYVTSAQHVAKVEAEANSSGWAQNLTARTLMRQFVVDEPNEGQNAAWFRILLGQAWNQVVPGERSSFWTNAMRAWGDVNSQRVRLLPGTTRQVVTSRNTQFTFHAPFGGDPQLAVVHRDRTYHNYTFSVSLPIAPKCHGCTRVDVPDAGKFLFCESAKTWSEARSACRAGGGHLASMHSEYEVAAARSVAPGAYDAWIGLSSLDTPGSFEWEDETSLDFLFWHVGEPNNWGGSELCAHVDYRNGQLLPRWNDTRCDGQRAYLCKVNQ